MQHTYGYAPVNWINFALCCHEGVWVGGIAPGTLTFDTRRKLLVSQLYSWEITLVPIEYLTEWAPEPVYTCGRREKFCRDSNHVYPACSLLCIIYCVCITHHVMGHQPAVFVETQFLIMPPINPTPRPYLRVTWRSAPWITWEAVTGVEGIPCRGLLRHTLANGAKVCPSQGGRYRAEGCMALG
jgi:hypothetical protein